MAMAPALLLYLGNQVDSAGFFSKAPGRQPNQKKETSKCYEEPPEADQGFQPDRIVSGNRDYRHPGSHAAAGAGPCQSPRATYQLHQQPETSRLGHAHMGT